MLFQYSNYFYGLAFIPLMVLFLLYGLRRKRKLLSLFSAPPAGLALTADVSRTMQYVKAFLLVGAVFFMIVTLARPKWGAKNAVVQQEGIDIIFAVDASTSMLAEDIKPSRLERAKYEINAFVEKLAADRVGLVLFAGSSYTACPLTIDYTAFSLFVNIIEPSLMNYQGTRIGDAIRVATKSFVAGENKHKALILLTDGEDHGSDARKAADEAKREGIRIFTIGLGSERGEPIPVRDANGNVIGYKKDARGSVVMTRTDDALLEDVAQRTDGAYFRSTTGELGLDEIYQRITGMERKSFGAEQLKQYEERFQIFCIFILTLLILELLLSERKIFRIDLAGRLFMRAGTTALFIIVLCGYAFAATPLLKWEVDQGNGQMKKERFDAALSRYERSRADNPGTPELDYNVGNALYRLGQFEKAAAEYEKALAVKQGKLKAGAHYNAGNAYLSAKDPEKAIAAYKAALRIDPNDIDAKKALELAMMMPVQKKQQEKQDTEDKQDKKKSQKQNDSSKQSQREEETKNEGKPKKISKDEAEKILNAMRLKQQEEMKNKKNTKQFAGANLDKDW
ncbi:MAG: VWA domain-containing protein [Spirochaetes bacterium]|nr:VWA domain-containing protein [Spirochaetota bacterium]